MKKEFRLSKMDNMYCIELLIDGEWCFSKGYFITESKMDGLNEVVHRGILDEINYLVDIGYTMVANSRL